MVQEGPSLPKRIGENVRSHIKEKGWTQDHFADLLGADPSTIRRWLSNGIDSISTVQQIADIFGIDIQELLS